MFNTTILEFPWKMKEKERYLHSEKQIMIVTMERDDKREAK